MLAQLVYVSKKAKHCTEEEIENILSSCKKNNPALDITGILLYSEERFIQLVEGESKTITTLYDKIKTDSRHTNCFMVSYAPIKEKKFPSWHMGSKKFKDDQIQFDTSISTEDKQIFELIMSGKEQENDQVVSLLGKLFAR